jgi:biotin--protein ligase
MQQIIVYVDKGVDGMALKHTVKSLQQETNIALKRMDASQLKTESWEKETALIVFPGGRDIFFHVALDGEGTDKIRSFVENGGAYLGICAGAYFASEAIEFEKGGSLEVCGKRSLMLYPGLAIGPAYGNNKYRYDNLHGIEAAHVSWNDNRFHAYYNGGCTFVDADKYSNVQILSSYLELESEPPAIVLCHVGKGKAMLTGVHLEYGIRHLQMNNPFIDRIFPLLQKGEEIRRKVLREILQQLHVAVKN